MEVLGMAHKEAKNTAVRAISIQQLAAAHSALTYCAISAKRTESQASGSSLPAESDGKLRQNLRRGTEKGERTQQLEGFRCTKLQRRTLYSPNKQNQ
jgi:hypothetical protein